MKIKLFNLLNITENESEDVIREKYLNLRSQYLENRFLEGEEGNVAAKNLTELDNAYNEYLSYKSQEYSSNNHGDLFSEIESLIRSGDLKQAQEKLDLFDERGAEWHYYQSVIFYKKRWINESKKQLEIALQIEPENKKYKDALNVIQENSNKQQFNGNDWNKSGNSQAGQGYNQPQPEPTQQLGGDSCAQWCCDMIICNTLLNCCCNCS